MKEKLFLVFITAFLACNISSAQLIGHYDESWKIIKTEHFDIVISAEHHDLGLYYAQAAERAYANLATVFTNLTERIVLVVNDTTDVTNGYATRIPYPNIMAYAVPASEHDALSESGDWARELITHELTHILQFEPATGLYSFLRPLFGTIIAPNMLTPAWWKEGMAVEMETQFTPRGRLRSTFQDATVRSLVLDNKLFDETLPRANEILPSWPYGSRPYLLGSLFFSQVTYDTKSLSSTGTLVNRQGERLPYFIEAPIQELTGRSYEMEYQAALNAAATNSLQQVKILDSTDYSIVHPIEQKNEASFQPQFSDKHNLLAYIENIEGKYSLVVRDEEDQVLKLKNLPTGQLQSLDFHPQEKQILYSQINNVDANHTYADLYVYNIDTQVSTRLTTAQRARSARYSGDGKSAVFITTFGGQTQIKTLDLTSKEISLIINTPLGNRYESPIFWDERRLLAVKVDPRGRRSLVQINLVLKSEKVLELDHPEIRFLTKVNDSLYFVSSKNGVNNIYASKDLKTAMPMSHVKTGIWSFDISHADESRSWASLMTSTGFKVVKLNLSPVRPHLPVIENEYGKRYTFTENAYTEKTYGTVDYEAAGYLLPRYWIPFISTSTSSTGVFLQAQTSGHDPLKRHQYALLASYDSELQKGNFSGAYTNSTQAIPFLISSTTMSRALGNASTIVQTSTHSVSLLPNVFSFSKYLVLQLGLQLQDTYLNSATRHAGPLAQISYKNFEQTIFQVSPESGWAGLFRLEKNYKLNEQQANTAQDYEKASFSAMGFASPEFLPEHHALKAKLSGLVTFSEVLGRYGSSSSTTFVEEDGIAPQFVMRGYSPAQFFGRSLWNTNFEYRFPLSNIEQGYGTDAYFFKRISGAVVVDGLGVEGSGLTKNSTTPIRPLKLSESIWSSGAELKLETTVGYILPMSFVLGYYFPHSTMFATGAQLGLSLQIGGF